jgi:hypothetical protein
MSQLSYRDFALLVDEFFQLNHKAWMSKLDNSLYKITDQEADRLKHLSDCVSKELKLFRAKETAELPFRFKDVSEIELTEEEREAALWEGKTKKLHHLRALERNNKNLKA